MKKQYILVVSLVLIIIGLSGLAITKYDNRPKAAPTISVHQAITERNNALRSLEIHDQINQVTATGSKNQITALTTQKTTLCTQIKAAKLVQPLCQ